MMLVAGTQQPARLLMLSSCLRYYRASLSRADASSMAHRLQSTAASAPGSITIAQPDDMHLHVRDGPMMQQVVPHTSQHFARAIIMPNLVPPVTTAAKASRTLSFSQLTACLQSQQHVRGLQHA